MAMVQRRLDKGEKHKQKLVLNYVEKREKMRGLRRTKPCVRLKITYLPTRGRKICKPQISTFQNVPSAATYQNRWYILQQNNNKNHLANNILHST